jgi:hypothetical protein
LQLAAMIGEYDAAARLVVCGGDPFRSSINYDAHSADFRHVGAPSALALAAAHGHRALLHMMLNKGHSSWSFHMHSWDDLGTAGRIGPAQTGDRVHHK